MSYVLVDSENSSPESPAVSVAPNRSLPMRRRPFLERVNERLRVEADNAGIGELEDDLPPLSWRPDGCDPLHDGFRSRPNDELDLRKLDRKEEDSTDENLRLRGTRFLVEDVLKASHELHENAEGCGTKRKASSRDRVESVDASQRNKRVRENVATKRRVEQFERRSRRIKPEKEAIQELKVGITATWVERFGGGAVVDALQKSSFRVRIFLSSGEMAGMHFLEGSQIALIRFSRCVQAISDGGVQTSQVVDEGSGILHLCMDQLVDLLEHDELEVFIGSVRLALNDGAEFLSGSLLVLVEGLQSWTQAQMNEIETAHVRAVTGESIERPTVGRARASLARVKDAFIWIQLRSGCLLWPTKDPSESAVFVAKYSKAVALKPYRRASSSYLDHLPPTSVNRGIWSSFSKTEVAWIRQLMQFRTCSEQVARAIVRAYPSPISLFEKFEDDSLSVEEKKALLADIWILEGRRRRIGPKLSRVIFEFFRTENGRLDVKDDLT